MSTKQDKKLRKEMRKNCNEFNLEIAKTNYAKLYATVNDLLSQNRVLTREKTSLQKKYRGLKSRYNFFLWMVFIVNFLSLILIWSK